MAALTPYQKERREIERRRMWERWKESLEENKALRDKNFILRLELKLRREQVRDFRREQSKRDK